jgi:hypothetical protein
MAVAESTRHQEARYHLPGCRTKVRAKLFPTVAASFEQGGDAANLKELRLQAPGQGAAAQIESVCADLADHVGQDRVDQDQLRASDIDDPFGGPNFIAAMVTTGGPWPSNEGRAPIANADSIGAVGNDRRSSPERRCAPQPSTSHLEPESGAGRFCARCWAGESSFRRNRGKWEPTICRSADRIARKTSWASNPEEATPLKGGPLCILGARPYSINFCDLIPCNLDPDTSVQKATKCLLCRGFYILSSLHPCENAKLQGCNSFCWANELSGAHAANIDSQGRVAFRSRTAGPPSTTSGRKA